MCSFPCLLALLVGTWLVLIEGAWLLNIAGISKVSKVAWFSGHGRLKSSIKASIKREKDITPAAAAA